MTLRRIELATAGLQARRPNTRAIEPLVKFHLDKLIKQIANTNEKEIKKKRNKRVLVSFFTKIQI